MDFGFQLGSTESHLFWNVHIGKVYNRTNSRLAPSQWETSLQSKAISHWLGANLESALYKVIGESG